MSKVHDYVTERLLAQLESGTVPWHKPWTGGLATNYVSGKAYRGINPFLLPDGGEYLSFKQVVDCGGKVEKGTKSYMVVFFKPIDGKPATANTPERTPTLILRYYNVFKASDCGLKTKRPAVEHNPIVEADRVIKAYTDNGGPLMIHGNGNGAFYTPSKDWVTMPSPSMFESPESYYSTAFHELVHSTGHAKRLDRFDDKVTQFSFASESYSKEELVAEFGAAMLAGDTGIDIGKIVVQSGAYLQSWIKVLKGDNSIAVSAAGKAQKAADFITQYSETEEVEE